MTHTYFKSTPRKDCENFNKKILCQNDQKCVTKLFHHRHKAYSRQSYFDTPFFGNQKS